jgi:hypothetical protein
MTSTSYVSVCVCVFFSFHPLHAVLDASQGACGRAERQGEGKQWKAVACMRTTR